MPIRLDAEAHGLLLRLADRIGVGDQPAQLVLVFATSGSAPRAAGARLLCRDGQLLQGTIGGGRLEAMAIEAAAELARDSAGGLFEPQIRRFALGPELAQCCGGAVELMFEAVDSNRAAALADEVRAAAESGAQLRTHCGDRTLEESPAGTPTVLVFGAGHVGAAVATALSVLPWRIVVIDERPQWASEGRLPEAVQVICTEPLRLLAAWGWLGEAAANSRMAAPAVDLGFTRPVAEHSAALVMTHSHDLDRDLINALLRLPERGASGRLRHLGLIGSRTKIASMRRRLLDGGLDPTLLAEVSAPIGLRVDGKLLGGKLPGEIAISAAAELLQVFDDSSTAAQTEPT